MPSAERVRWAKLRVVALTLSALIILCALLYELFGSLLFTPKTYAYLYVPDGSGLTQDSPVRVDGIDVGRVARVELSGSNQPSRVVKVTLSVRRDRLTTIPADSVTQISSDSLIGDKFVDIVSGASLATLRPGGEVVFKDQPEMLRSLDLTQFTQQLRLMDVTLTDIEQGRSQFGQFYQGDAFYKDLQKRLTDLQIGIQAGVSTTSTIGSLLSSDQLHRQVSDLLTGLDQSVAKIQASPMLRNTAQYDQLVSTAQGLQQTLKTLGANDLLQSTQTYDNLSLTLTNLLRSVDDLNRNPQIATTAVYENLNGSLQQLQESIRDFRLNPKKYLHMKLF